MRQRAWWEGGRSGTEGEVGLIKERGKGGSDRGRNGRVEGGKERRWWETEGKERERER